MSFKIWGKTGTFNEIELQEKLKQLGVNDVFSLIRDVINKGSALVGQERIFLLK